MKKEEIYNELSKWSKKELDLLYIKLTTKNVKKITLDKTQYKHSHWTKKELDLLYSNLNNEELAQKIKRSPQSINQKRLNLNILDKKLKIWTQIELDMLNTQFSNKEIAQKTGRTPRAIYHKRKYLGIDSITTEVKKILEGEKYRWCDNKENIISLFLSKTVEIQLDYKNWTKNKLPGYTTIKTIFNMSSLQFLKHIGVVKDIIIDIKL